MTWIQKKYTNFVVVVGCTHINRQIIKRQFTNMCTIKMIPEFHARCHTLIDVNTYTLIHISQAGITHNQTNKPNELTNEENIYIYIMRE